MLLNVLTNVIKLDLIVACYYRLPIAISKNKGAGHTLTLFFVVKIEYPSQAPLCFKLVPQKSTCFDRDFCVSCVSYISKLLTIENGPFCPRNLNFNVFDGVFERIFGPKIKVLFTPKTYYSFTYSELLKN